MADVNANIGINIDTSQSLAEIKALQRQLAQLYTSINKGSAAAAAAQKGLATNLMNTINAGGKFYAQMGTIRTSTESFTHALEKNKLTMREYFRYAGGSTKTFGKLFKQEFDTIGRVAEERVKKMQTQYIKLGRDASGAMKAISITPTTLNMKDYGNQVAVAAQKQALLNQLLKQGSTNLLNFGKNTQWAGRQLMVGFTVPLTYFGTAAAKTFMDLEAQALKFKRVYGGMFTTTAETNKALQDIELLAKEFTKYGVAVSKTMEMAAAAAAMGKTGAELNAQVAEATRLAVLGNVEQQQALDTTISLTNAFGISADELAQKINFLNSVENQTVTAIEDLTIAIPKAGPVIKQLGGSVEDLAFFLTAMREGGINASEGANALKSGLASLINPTKKAAAMLNDMGINIAAIVEQNQGNLREIVVDFAQALDTLSPLERSRAIEQLFGKFQFARLSTLFQNVTKDGTQASRVLDLAGKSVEELAILSERELKAVEDAVGTNFRAAVEELKLAIAPIGKEFLKAITPVVKFLGDLLEKFNGLSDGSKKFIVVLTTLVGLVGPTLLMTFGLVANGAANIIKLFLLMRQGFLKLTGNTTNLAQQTQYMNTEQQEAAIVAASLNQAHTKLTQQFTLEATAVNQLRNAYVQATAAATRFAAANPGMMMPGFKPGIKGGGTAKFASGTPEVTGGQPGKDSVPSLLTPGEAVIPAGIAQDDRFKPIIAALVSGEIAKYEDGTTEVEFGGKKYNAKSAKGAKDIRDFLNSLEKNPDGTYNYVDPKGEYSRKNIPASRIAEVLKGRADSNKFALNEIKEKLRLNKEGIQRALGATSVQDPKIKELRDIGARAYVEETKFLQNEIKKSGIVLTRAQLDEVNKTVAAHLNPLLTKDSGTGEKIWDPRNLMADKQFVNNYVQGLTRDTNLTNLLKLDDQQFSRALGINPDEAKEYRKTLEGIKSGRHPTKGVQAKALAAYANYDFATTKKPYAFLTSKAMEYRLAQGFYGSKQMPFLESIRKEQIRAGKYSRTTKWEKASLKNIGGKILAFKGERIIDAKGRVVGTVTGQNTKAKTAKQKPTSRNVKDNRLLNLKPGMGVMPPKFAGIKGAGLRYLPGADEGFPPTASTPGAGIKTGAVAPGYRQSIAKAQDSFDNVAEENTKTAKNTKTFGAKVSGGINVFSGLTIAGSFMGGKIGEVSQKLAPFAIGLSTVAMLLPSLKSGITKLIPFLVANPWVAVLAALTALALTFKVVSDRNNKMAKEQSRYIDAISATTDKMKRVGEVTGEVGASQIMQRRREGQTADKFTTGYDRAGQQFGTSFLESEVGKEIYTTFAENIKKGGSEAVKNIALELSAYVSDGLMTAEQANSIARAIGINMSDMTIATNIQGELRSLIGPNGEDLLTNPLEVRLKIAKESQQSIADILSEFDRLTADKTAGAGAPAAAALAASATQSLEIIQAQRDAQNEMYNNKIKDLQAQLAITKDLKKQKEIQDQISGLTKQQASDDAILAEERQKTINAELKAFKQIQRREKGGSLINYAEGAFFTAKQEQVVAKYKGTGQEPFVKTFLETAKDTKSKQLEITFLGLVGAGDLTPLAATNLIEMFGKGKEAELEAIINSKVALQNPDKFAQLANIAGGLKGKGSKQVGIDIISQLTAAGGEDKFDDRLAALTLLQKMDGKEINVAAFLKDGVTGKLDNLIPKLNKIEEIKGPITITVLENFATNNPDMNLGQLIDDWEHYVNLPAETQKTAIQTFITAYETIGAKEKEQFAISQAGGATSGTVYDYWMKQSTGAVAAALTKKQFAAGQKPNVIPKGKGGGTGGGKSDPFEDLNKKLRTFRDFTISASGGLEQLKKLFKDDKAITKFSGSLQTLAAGPKGGINRGFLDYLSDLDQKTFMSLINQKKFKKGILELNDTGKAIKDTFNAIDIGVFQSQLDLGAQNTLAQQSAFIKLKNAGIDTITAMKLVANEELAVAINAKKTDGSIKELVDSFYNAESATNAFNVQLQESLIRNIEDFELLKQMPSLVENMKKLGLNSEQIGKVLDNPDLAKSLMQDLKDGKIDSELIARYLNSIPDTKKVKIELQMQTPEGQYDIFKQGFSEAMDFFDAQEALITQQREPGLKLITDEIERLQEAITKAEAKITPFEQKIADLQYKLEYDPEFGARAIDKLKEQIEKEQKEIQKLNDQIDEYRKEIETRQRFIELNFERPIQALQDESNVLSNTLTLIEQKENDINKKYDLQEKALQKVSEVNQEIIAQEKQRLSIADALTQGDIAAAAQAAQEARAQAAEAASQRAGGVLQAAREAEIGAVTVGGMTRAQIEQRQFQISQQIFKLEQDRKVIDAQILYYQDEIYKKQQQQVPFQEKIKLIEEQIAVKEKQRAEWTEQIANNQFEIDRIKREEIEPSQLLLDQAEKAKDAYIKSTEELFKSLDYLGKTKDQWIKTNVEIDAAKTKGEELKDIMNKNLGIVSAIAGKWKEIDSKTVTLTVNTIYTSSGNQNPIQPNQGNFRMYGGKIKPMMYGGKAKPMAFGGRVGSDSVPAMLTPGEFVVNKASTNAFGPLLGAINDAKYPSMIASKLAQPQYPDNFISQSYSQPIYTISMPSSFLVPVQNSVNSINDNSNTVYNYSVGINVGGTNTSADNIAKAVLNEIKYIDSQRIRGQRA